jgi:hypothetical protein
VFLGKQFLRVARSGLVDQSSTICCYPLQLESFLDALAVQAGCRTMLRGILRSEICQARLNSLSILTCNFIHRDTIVGDVTMLNLKFAATIAAVLLMSAAAAQAGGRPFVVSGMSNSKATIVAMTIEYRRQANHHVDRLSTVPGIKLASSHRPVSKPIRAVLMTAKRSVHSPDRVPDRLSAISSSDIRFENRPGPVSNGFKVFAAGNIKVEDHPRFTASLSQATTLRNIHTSFVEFCAGSTARCDLVPFYSATRISMSAIGEPSKLPSSPF